MVARGASTRNTMSAFTLSLGQFCIRTMRYQSVQLLLFLGTWEQLQTRGFQKIGQASVSCRPTELLMYSRHQVLPFCEDPGNISFSTRQMASPTSAVVALPPRSRVLISRPPIAPESRTLPTAASTAAASLSNAQEYLSNRARESICPIGFTIPRPAMSGAVPWTGSYRPLTGAPPGGPDRDADGSRPSEPGIVLDSSERISPNVLSVNKTPLSDLGFFIMIIAALSAN